MSKADGISYIEIGGQKRPLRFGTNQTEIFCDLQNIELDQYGPELAKMEKKISVSKNLLFSALKDGARKEKLTIDFDPDTVGDWMDEARNEGKLQKLMEEMGAAMTNSFPNGKAQEQPMKASA